MVEQYEKALEDCPDNHDEIDYQIARADEVLKERLGTLAEERCPSARLQRLKRLETGAHVLVVCDDVDRTPCNRWVVVLPGRAARGQQAVEPACR